jgi:DNA-binding response OmpR family regulator
VLAHRTLGGHCKDAKDALAESPYDVVLLDLGLPDGDGIDLLRQWRASGFNEPVLILSARDSVEDRVKGSTSAPTTTFPSPSASRSFSHACARSCGAMSSVKQTVLEHRGIRLDLLSHTVHQSTARPSTSPAANTRCSRSSCRTPGGSSPARSSRRRSGRRTTTSTPTCSTST